MSQADWAPHEKSMTLGRLAGHIAEMPEWGAGVLTTEEYDMNPAEGEGYVAPEINSVDDLLAAQAGAVDEVERVLA
jgi:hypothetical protein